ncbi:hypothetical protein [Streptomyces sp. NPDC050504]|uniref:hypothetical protein n=1 Tax=Streptomyces sp. NPDC050504 TaxID=3365618 RepID=UPI0037B581D2
MTQPQPYGDQGWGQPPQGPPPPRKKRRTLLYVLLGVAAFIVLIAVAGALTGSTDNDVSPPKKSPSPPPAQEKTSSAESGPRADVEVTGCVVDSTTSWPEAKLRITNHSSKASDYWINVEFVDAKGERVAEGFAATNHLAPAQVANESANGFTQTSDPIKCRITEVSRRAS